MLPKETKYLVRNCKKGDEVRLAQIYSECFGPTTPRSIKKWHRRVGILPEHTFLGEVEGKLVSSVTLEFKKLHLGEGLYLKTGGIAGVCTDSDYRRKGIVTNLMKQALSYAKQSGVSNSALFTDLDIPAHRIYSRLGFIDIETFQVFINRGIGTIHPIGESFQMHLLVTGGLGFIGSNFIRHMFTKYDDIQITNLDKLSIGFNPANLKDVETNKRYRFVKGDITDEKLVKNLVNEAEVVVNIAAETHVDRSIAEPWAFIRSNTLGAVTLFEAAKNTKSAYYMYQLTKFTAKS